MRPYTTAEDVYCGSFRANEYLMFNDPDTFHHKCDIDCTVYLVPSRPDTLSEDELGSGAYSRHEKGAKMGDALILKRHLIQKIGDSISTPFIDSGADLVDFSFICDDQMVEEKSKLEGTFAYDIGADRTCDFELKGETDSEGRVLMALPAGSVDASLKTKSGAPMKSKKGAPIGIRKVIPRRPIYPSNVVTPDEPEPVITIVDSTILAYLHWMKPDRPVVVLGDMSGSMGNGDRMVCLRKTLQHMYDAACKATVPIALMTWDSWTEYCTPSIFAFGGGTLPYLTKEDASMVNEWCSSRNSRGGNDMRYAIEDAIRNYPTARDIVIMCDGDIRPFEVAGGAPVPPGSTVAKAGCYSDEAQGNYDWTAFRENHPDKCFHFVAFSEGASHDDMQTMARIGNGSFTSANKG